MNWEERIDAIYDELRKARTAREANDAAASPQAPMCRVCGEMKVVDRLRGVCTRCMWALEHDRLERESNR